METIYISPEVANYREILSIGYTNLTVLGTIVIGVVSFIIAFFARS